MGLIVTTAPDDPAVTVEEAKLFAKVENNADDDLIEELIEAATAHVEQATGRQFIVAEFMQTMRCFPGGDGIIVLPRSPLLSVESVQYRDHAGDLQSLMADDDWLVDFNSEPGTLEPVVRWPATGDFPDSVQITFTAGYEGDENSPPDPAANVPKRAKVAIKALAAWWYEQREPVAFTQAHEVPHHVNRLLNGLRVWR